MLCAIYWFNTLFLRTFIKCYMSFVGARVEQSVHHLGYGLDEQGSIPSRDKRFFSFPEHPDQLWGTPSLLINRLLGLYT
jgi:hypothetical protein